MHPGEILSLTVTIPNGQRIEVPEAVGCWSRVQELVVEGVDVEQPAHARRQHYVKRLVKRFPLLTVADRARSHHRGPTL